MTFHCHPAQRYQGNRKTKPRRQCLADCHGWIVGGVDILRSAAMLCVLNVDVSTKEKKEGHETNIEK